MAVKHAVLGLLLERRGYGYDLLRRMEERLGPAWQLNPSTIYTALDQLEEGGMIVGTPRPGPQPAAPKRRGRRVVYEATEAGREHFDGWIATPEYRQEPIRGELLLKAATARPEDTPALLRAIEHAELATQRLHEECMDAAAEPPRPDGLTEDAAIGGLARAAALLHLKAELRWLSVVRRSLAKNPSQPTGPGGAPVAL